MKLTHKIKYDEPKNGYRQGDVSNKEGFQCLSYTIRIYNMSFDNMIHMGYTRKSQNFFKYPYKIILDMQHLFQYILMKKSGGYYVCSIRK